jgi:peptide/nickel transport system permease protein
MAVAELEFGAQELAAPQEESQLVVVWRRFRRHRLAVAGLFIVAILGLGVAVGPALTPHDAVRFETRYFATDRELPPLTRSPASGKFYVLGTDSSSRDYLTRLLQAGRVSMGLAVSVTLLFTVAGTAIGALSGYMGGWLDALIMRIVDFILTLPFLPILMVLSVMLRPYITGGSVAVLLIILPLFYWVGPARLVRGMALSLRSQEFTDAARALGASDARIIFRHIIPNSLAPAIVAATLSMGTVIVVEAILSYLGFGVQPPEPSWGNMLQDVRSVMLSKPWIAFYPGLAIFMTSLSFNFIGDALRDALDPRLKM